MPQTNSYIKQKKKGATGFVPLGCRPSDMKISHKKSSGYWNPLLFEFYANALLGDLTRKVIKPPSIESTAEIIKVGIRPPAFATIMGPAKAAMHTCRSTAPITTSQQFIVFFFTNNPP
jgi:hypothetical protein